MKKSILSVAVVVVCGLMVAVASAAEKVAQAPNPAYKIWSQFKVGSSVTYKNEMEIKVDAADAAAMPPRPSMTMTRKLVELTPEKAVIETAMTMNMNGQERTMPAQRQDVLATVDADKASASAYFQSSQMPGTVSDIKEGDEDATVMGKTLKCHTFSATMTQNTMKMQIKIWINSDTPGGMVKTENRSDQMNSTMTLTAVNIAK